jgi:hypothetical protein|tara:strand:+ start:500 stop:742 length:243 start_codon:yes stop_codon:yes gene_type:complete
MSTPDSPRELIARCLAADEPDSHEVPDWFYKDYADISRMPDDQVLQVSAESMKTLMNLVLDLLELARGQNTLLHAIIKDD